MTATIHKLKIGRCPTCGRPPKRSSAANSRYWALLHLISDELAPQSQYYHATVWHNFFKAKFLGCTDTRLPNGKVLTVPNSTSELDTARFLDYTTAVEHFASEHGCYLEE